jgi:ketosteroid isomerase-like protein
MTDGDDVLARADAWQAALQARDVEGVADFLHDDYALMIVHPAPLTVPREQWLRMLPEYVVSGYEIRSREVSVDGDAAAVLQLVDQRATAAGGDRSGPFVISDHWRRDPADRAWRVWKRHSTPLSGIEMPNGMNG